MLAFCIVALALAGFVQPKEFQFVNRGSQTIWIGILGNKVLEHGGFELASGQQVNVPVTDNWSGRMWARTGCSFDAKGMGPCEVGDCGNKLQCNGAGGVPPVSLAEFTMGDTDFYDVSFVDGLNVPIEIISLGGAPDNNNPYSCQTAGCTVNLLPNCPSVLQVMNSAGQTVACRSSCNKFGTDEYCCAGQYNNPNICNPSNWEVDSASYFKRNCPNAYSYAYDDGSSTYICQHNNVGYMIVFY